MAKQAALGDKKRAFVEEMGIFYERLGQPKIQGLIMGYLLVCEPAHQTTGQIQEALGVSAGSVSTLVRKLEEHQFLERAVVPGSRGKHYRIMEGAWTRLMVSRQHVFTKMREMGDKGLALMPRSGGPDAARLREFRGFHAFMEREMPRLFRRWERQRLREER